MPASGEHPRIKSSTVSFLPAGCEPSDAEADAIFSVGMAKPAETLFESLASPEEGATRPAPARKWMAAKTARAHRRAMPMADDGDDTTTTTTPLAREMTKTTLDDDDTRTTANMARTPRTMTTRR